MHNNKQKTQEEYIQELSIKRPEIKVIGKYINAKTPILHKCKIHNYTWNICPSNVLSGKSCKLCANENRKNKMTLSNEQYVEKLKIKLPHVHPIEPYIDAKTPINHYCNIHQLVWKSTPNVLLYGDGYGCQECALEQFRKSKYKTYKEYEQQLNSICPTIKCVGHYVCATMDALHKCTVCNTEWMAHPTDILLGMQCPHCRQNRVKTHDEYVQEILSIDSDICVIGKYVNYYTPILHKCLKDGNLWFATPGNILKKHTGCPKCRRSKGEKIVENWLGTHNISYIPQYTFDNCIDKKHLRYDFYLPMKNMCIEYDGIQHFKSIDYFGGDSAFSTIKYHDKLKDEYCQKNGIPLLRIPYYKNIEEELNNFLFN